MKSLFSRFTRRDRTVEGSSSVPPALAYEFPVAPLEPFVAIGDVHGRDDLLAALLAELTRAAPAAPLVLLGDLVDRGPDSAAVLTRVQAMCEAHASVVCLKGNHEQMLLDFLDDPAGRGLKWLDFGGRETMQSFKLKAPAAKADLEDVAEAAEALEDAMGRDLIAWMRQLPTRWMSGQVIAVHAALDPARAPVDQSDRSVLWGHPEFFTKTRTDGLWVVHGHTIFSEPYASSGRISCDTGAYQTGRLSAALIGSGAADAAVQFLQA